MTTYEKCEHEGCDRAAQFAPKICVPAMGWPQDEKRALSALMGLKLCRDHCREFRAVEQFTNPETATTWRQIFQIMARAASSSIPPDFTRAWVKPLPLDGEEFKIFDAQKKQSLH